MLGESELRAHQTCTQAQMGSFLVQLGTDLGQDNTLHLHDTQFILDGGKAMLIELALQLENSVLLLHFRQTGAIIHETIHRLHHVTVGCGAIQ